MRALADIFGLLVCILGVLCTLSGWVIGAATLGGGIIFWFGVALILVGAMIASITGEI